MRPWKAGLGGLPPPARRILAHPALGKWDFPQGALSNTAFAHQGEVSMRPRKEADGSLCPRDMAGRTREAHFENRSLAAMGERRGLMICGSSRREGVDPAAMGRFSWKAPFGHPASRQLRALSLDFPASCGKRTRGAPLSSRLSREKTEGPGDPLRRPIQKTL
jgi:hypothetical protein